MKYFKFFGTYPDIFAIENAINTGLFNQFYTTITLISFDIVLDPNTGNYTGTVTIKANF